MYLEFFSLSVVKHMHVQILIYLRYSVKFHEKFVLAPAGKAGHSAIVSLTALLYQYLKIRTYLPCNDKAFFTSTDHRG